MEQRLLMSMKMSPEIIKAVYPLFVHIGETLPLERESILGDQQI